MTSLRPALRTLGCLMIASAALRASAHDGVTAGGVIGGVLSVSAPTLSTASVVDSGLKTLSAPVTIPMSLARKRAAEAFLSTHQMKPGLAQQIQEIRERKTRYCDKQKKNYVAETDDELARQIVVGELKTLCSPLQDFTTSTQEPRHQEPHRQ